MRDRIWSWPIASYLFLGGLGSSMAIIASAADLIFGQGEFFVACSLVSVIALAVGVLFLVFELGKPFRAWRAFSRQHAVLTFGCWSLTVLLISEVLYFLFWSGWLPGGDLLVGRRIFGVITFIAGWCVLVYTGVELSSMKGRVMWNTPALPILFVISGFLNGASMDYLLIGVWPHTAAATAAIQAVNVGLMSIICLGLGVLTLACLFVFVCIMYAGQGKVARNAAGRWLKGQYALPFWIGLVGCCLVLPILLFIFGAGIARTVAAILFVISGVFVRYLIVFSDDRRVIPGYQEYMDLLPGGDELFMKRKEWF